MPREPSVRVMTSRRSAAPGATPASRAVRIAPGRTWTTRWRPGPPLGAIYDHRITPGAPPEERARLACRAGRSCRSPVVDRDAEGGARIAAAASRRLQYSARLTAAASQRPPHGARLASYPGDRDVARPTYAEPGTAHPENGSPQPVPAARRRGQPAGRWPRWCPRAAAHPAGYRGRTTRQVQRWSRANARAPERAVYRTIRSARCVAAATRSTRRGRPDGARVARAGRSPPPRRP